MKKLFVYLFIIFVFLGGCSKVQDSVKFEVKDFSYEADLSTYQNDYGVKRSGFINTEKYDIKTVDQVVELAKKECTVEYDIIDVAFDATMKIYRVSFSKENLVGGNQDIYINQDGITVMSISGE